MKILLMGNPNVGKSVLFSRLTGVRVIASNYPGTTIGYTRGYMKLGDNIAEVIDVPGTYTLEPTSEAEEIACQMLNTAMRMTRTMMLEVLRQDYIRTAWSKGLRESVVVTRHALKNALIPVVTIIGLQLPVLLGGAVIMEQIFALPGMGRLMLDALNARDYPIVSGVNLVMATAILVANLLVDLSYAWLDPRIRYR